MPDRPNPPPTLNSPAIAALSQDNQVKILLAAYLESPRTEGAAGSLH